jgi:hypothetical protein
VRSRQPKLHHIGLNSPASIHVTPNNDGLPPVRLCGLTSAFLATAHRAVPISRARGLHAGPSAEHSSEAA